MRKPVDGKLSTIQCVMSSVFDSSVVCEPGPASQPFKVHAGPVTSFHDRRWGQLHFIVSTYVYICIYVGGSSFSPLNNFGENK